MKRGSMLRGAWWVQAAHNDRLITLLFNVRLNEAVVCRAWIVDVAPKSHTKTTRPPHFLTFLLLCLSQGTKVDSASCEQAGRDAATNVGQWVTRSARARSEILNSFNHSQLSGHEEPDVTKQQTLSFWGHLNSQTYDTLTSYKRCRRGGRGAGGFYQHGPVRTNNWCKLSTSRQELFLSQEPPQCRLRNSWAGLAAGVGGGGGGGWDLRGTNNWPPHPTSPVPTFTLIRSLSVTLMKHSALKAQSGMYRTIWILCGLNQSAQKLSDFDWKHILKLSSFSPANE